MSPRDLTTLIHLVGFLTGVALYAMLGVMTLRSPSGSRDRIPVATAILGLAWNFGALFIYTFPGFGFGVPSPWATALAFAALGFLPAVLVQAAVETVASRGRAHHVVAALAYALSTTAAVLHLAGVVTRGFAPSRTALIILTAGYAVVIAALALVTRGQDGWQRGLSGVGLAAFAVMALHLSQHSIGESWPVELLGHHATLPLALVILYQDYRFALADLFLKRALTMLTVIALALGLYVGVAAPYIMPRLAADPLDLRATVALLALWTLSVLTLPLVRRVIDRFVDRVVLGRVDYRALRAQLERRIALVDKPEAVLDSACEAIQPAISARRVRWTTESARPERDSDEPESAAHRTVLEIPVIPAEAPAYRFEVDELTAGRRLLSDDIAMLEAVSVIVARRIDALRVSQERYDRTLREQEIQQLATEAELRALRAQLNPHFLFNALTTIAQLVQEAPPRALDTLYRLTGLLRATLKRSEGEFTTLGEEIELVESYLAIERARFEDRLSVSVDVPFELLARRVPPFILQPLVENAVKHGIAARRTGGRIVITASVEGIGPNELLTLTVADSGVGIAPQDLARRRADGVGLTNVERRLAQYFGDASSLVFTSVPGTGTTVEVRLPIPAALTHSLVGASR